MPQRSTSQSATMPLRRSSRLNSALVAPCPAQCARAMSKLRRHASPRGLALDGAAAREPCPDGDAAPPMPATPAQLAQREKAVLQRERELCRKAERLTKLELDVSRSEEALRARTAAEMALAQLEEHFLCPLCFEVMASPYMLTPAQCGHTFCALCTAKWFFSRLHRGCGGWHESVDCPMCRALLILTPDRVPRGVVTVPFAPNRIADSVLGDLVRRLGGRCPRGAAPAPDGKRVGAAAAKGDGAPPTPALDAWAEGGALRTDWLERSRLGRIEMEDIVGRWKTLDCDDFIAIKSRLGV